MGCAKPGHQTFFDTLLNLKTVIPAYLDHIKEQKSRIFLPLDFRSHVKVIYWSGVRGKIDITVQLCSIV